MLRKLALTSLLGAAALVPSSAFAEGWFGFMNVFDNNGGAQGGYIFGSPWGLADVKTTVNVSNTGTYIGDNLTLQPNFNAYNGADSFWSDGLGNGNKFMEANTYVEFTPITDASATFTGTINSYTLSGAYDAFAFIKVLNPGNGYSLDLFQTVDLASLSQFTVTADLSAHSGKLLQMGFLVSGLNANPLNEAALGSVIVTITSPIPEPSTYALIGGALAGIAAVVLRRRRS